MLILTFALILILALSPSAVADTLFTYTGDTFRTVSGIYTLEDRITGSFTVAGGFVPEPATVENFTPGVISYSFTDGHQTLTEANSTGSFILEASLLLHGFQPRYWRVETNTASPCSTATNCAWIVSDLGIENADRRDQGFLNLTNTGFNHVGGPVDGSVRGAWTVQTVPEPMTTTLMLLGVGGVGAASWLARRCRSTRTRRT